jgi:hypothetical protein
LLTFLFIENYMLQQHFFPINAAMEFAMYSAWAGTQRHNQLMRMSKEEALNAMEAEQRHQLRTQICIGDGPVPFFR